MKIEYKGDILAVRELEDTIRATRKYTKGAFSKAVSHPIQGEQFPSKVLTEYYEVYPDLEVSWDMRAGDAWAWVWGDVIHIDIMFLYDYRGNKAKVTIHGGEGAVKELAAGIPGFCVALERVKQSGANGSGKKDVGTGQGTSDNATLQREPIQRELTSQPSSFTHHFSLLLSSSPPILVHMTVEQA